MITHSISTRLTPCHQSFVDHDNEKSLQWQSQKRRLFLQFLSTLTTTVLSVSPPPALGASSPTLDNKRFNFFSLSVMDSKTKKVTNGENTTPVNVPEVQQNILDGFLLGNGLDIESWMLKLLPIKNNVFQTLQQDIASVSILRGLLYNRSEDFLF